MNFKLNNTISNEINTLIIGIPEHLNQLSALVLIISILQNHLKD